MGRRGRKRGQPLNGWVILDKPQGLTSAQAVGAVKRLLDPQKAGHAGTLDPMATGVLPIGLGEATKTMSHVTDSTKEYEFTVRWGEARTTDDAEGEVTGTSAVRPTVAAIDRVLPNFIGDIEQQPPAYSALKVDGRRAYELARAGVAPDLKTRTVSVFELERLVDATVESDAGAGGGEEQTRFRLCCGKGTYVRALARDLARALGTLGYVTAIRRTRVGPFRESAAISLESLEVLSHSARAAESLEPVMTALADIPELAVTKQEALRMRQGQILKLPTAMSGTVCVTHEGLLLAIAKADKGSVRPLRIFNLD